MFDKVKTFVLGGQPEITPPPSKEELERPWSKKESEPIYQEPVVRNSQFSHDDHTYVNSVNTYDNNISLPRNRSEELHQYDNAPNQAAHHTYENLPETDKEQLDQQRLGNALRSKEFRAIAGSLSEHPLFQKGLKVASPDATPPVQNERQKNSRTHG